jgi:hypothetical protein
MNQCKGITQKGVRCKKYTGKSEYCIYHSPYKNLKIWKITKKKPEQDLFKGKCRRAYIYSELYDKVVEFGRKNIKNSTPNNKANFPYYLDQYIKKLESDTQ